MPGLKDLHELDSKKPKVTKVGGYVFGRTLGKGAFGKVKHATHILTGEEVAIKIVKAQNMTVMDEIEKEINVLKLLKHPHIVKLKDVIRDVPSKRIYMVLELITGGELFDRIVSEGHIPESDARRLFRQMISAVEYCHGNLIVHRDLKPENMLMDGNGNVKVNDFGFSNFIKPGEFLKTSCGSPIYAAPEVVMQQMYVGTQVDIWSLGVVLFAMCVGHLPWSVDKYGHIKNLQDLLDGKFTIPASLSKELRELLKKMIEPNTTKRATLQEVKFHTWVNIGYSSPPPCYLEHRRVPIERVNEEVLKQLIPLKFDIAAARRSILENEQCLATSIYHLFLEQLAHKFDLEVGGKDKALLTSSGDDTIRRRSGTVAEPGADEHVGRPRRMSFSAVGSAATSSVTRPSTPATTRVNVQPKLPTLSEGGDDPVIVVAKPSPRDSPLPSHVQKSKHMSLPTKMEPLVIPTSPNVSRPGTPAGESPRTPRKTSLGAKVLSIFKKSRRNSLSETQTITPGEFNGSPDEASLRTVKGLFNVCAVSHKNPAEVIGVLSDLLAELGTSYERDGYLFRCKHKVRPQSASAAASPASPPSSPASFLPQIAMVEVTFEAEICRVKDQGSIGIRLKRKAGDVWAYKSMYRELTSKLKL